MFCRSCYYDLRGQIEPRCPECSRCFSFDAPDTWLAEIPTLAGQVSDFVGALVLALVRLILIILMIGSYFAIPDLEGCGRYPTIGITRENLETVMAEWARQSGGQPINCSFDKEVAKTKLWPRVSPVFERAELGARRTLQHKISIRAGRFIGPLFFGMLLAFTYPKLTKTAIWVDGGALIVAILIVALSTRVSEWVHPGSHAFLDEYWLLDAPFPHQTGGARPEFIVVAIEKEPERKGVRMVGMANGIMTGILDDDLGYFLACPHPDSFDPRGRFSSANTAP